MIMKKGVKNFTATSESEAVYEQGYEDGIASQRKYIVTKLFISTAMLFALVYLGSTLYFYVDGESSKIYERRLDNLQNDALDYALYCSKGKPAR